MAKSPAKKAAAAPAETRIHKALAPILADGVRYAPGEEIEVDRATFDAFARAGALAGAFEDGAPAEIEKAAETK